MAATSTNRCSTWGASDNNNVCQDTKGLQTMTYLRSSMLAVGVALVFAALSLFSPASAQEGFTGSIHIQNHTQVSVTRWSATGRRTGDRFSGDLPLEPGYSTFIYIDTFAEVNHEGCVFDLSIYFSNGTVQTLGLPLCGNWQRQVLTLQ
jgi:hypothetical protein